MSTEHPERIVIKADGISQCKAASPNSMRKYPDHQPEMRFANFLTKTLDTSEDEESRDAATTKLVEMVIGRLEFPVLSSIIDLTLSECASEISLDSPIYANTAITIERENIYNETEPTFSGAMLKGWTALSQEFLDLVRRHRRSLDKMVVQHRDSLFSHAALVVFRRSYALRNAKGIVERPQYLFLRAALQVHKDDMQGVKASYDLISTFRFMPASPILFNSGTPEAQLSSCFLLSAESDSDEIFDTLAQTADISRTGGGIGLGLQLLSGQGSSVDGVVRSGIPPILKMFDAAVEVIDQGAGKRPSSVCVYVEPWHADVLSVIRMKRVTGEDATHTERLFYGLWINDLFMERVHQDLNWTLFCPSDASQLVNLCGLDFDDEYERLETSGLGRTTIKARELWKEIILSQVESGGPFIMYKDSVNEKSNERHLGTITHANLCTEIVQKSGSDETAVCNLSSVILTNFIKMDGSFDFATLEAVVRQVVLFLNCAIRQTHAPTRSAKTSMANQRAIGIGVQALADTFARMGYPFDSDEAFKLNAEIAETIYYAAVDESCNLIKTFGTYPTFKESPTYHGVLQFDFWDNPILSNRYNWDNLRNKVKKGMSNSLLVAYMPTAGTTQLTGCSEGIEPYTSMIFSRKVRNGGFTVIPYPLVSRLQDLDLWNEEMVNRILSDDGSIQEIESIPPNIRAIFKTAWEIEPSVLVKMAAARGPFVCQSQSMSLFFKNPSLTEISKALFLGWRLGLKTGMYYLRTKPAARPLPITIPVDLWSRENVDENDDMCMLCSA